MLTAEAVQASRTTPIPERPAPPTPPNGLTPWQRRKVLTYIHDRLAEKLSVTEAANLARLSASHFSRVFKRSFGSPFGGYVIQQRLRRAEGLLRDTDLPIARIAQECGLVDQAYLTRLFHRAYGLPPHAWRRRLPAAASAG